MSRRSAKLIENQRSQ